MSFTIRVYGICIDELNRVLVSDEYIYDRYITKFPGGGLQPGEGLLDCLKREMVEETLQEIEVLEHFYTTDFYVASAFDPALQVISVYYRVKFISPARFRVSERAFDFPELKNEAQTFRWINISELSADDMTLPIDRHVAVMLAEKKRMT
jgi:8-oxo-dGTP diphosphatase